jgi:hypothetical protein
MEFKLGLYYIWLEKKQGEAAENRDWRVPTVIQDRKPMLNLGLLWRSARSDPPGITGTLFGIKVQGGKWPTAEDGGVTLRLPDLASDKFRAFVRTLKFVLRRGRVLYTVAYRYENSCELLQTKNL